MKDINTGTSPEFRLSTCYITEQEGMISDNERSSESAFRALQLAMDALGNLHAGTVIERNDQRRSRRFRISLALNTGMRDAEIKTLTWGQIDFTTEYLAVGRSKTEAGKGRTSPLNFTLLEVFSDYGEWYREKFEKPHPESYVFPFGKPSPSDPTRPVTTLKTACNNVRKNAEVKGRWHDNRHTLITDLAESGAGDQTIMDIAGHVSKQLLKTLQPHSDGGQADGPRIHSKKASG